MPTYIGLRVDGGAARVYRLDALSCKELDPSLDIRRHSPTGLEWGYRGSGPAQTALAILRDATDDVATALKLYQRFKFDVIGGLPRAGWMLPVEAVEAWLIGQLGQMTMPVAVSDDLDLGSDEP